jgi:hypothetical protein
MPAYMSPSSFVVDRSRWSTYDFHTNVSPTPFFRAFVLLPSTENLRRVELLTNQLRIGSSSQFDSSKN